MAPTATKVEFKPLGDYVCIEPAEQAQMSAGGVFIPDTAKEKPQEGIVIAVGPGLETEKGVVPMHVKVGDKVVYSKYSGSEIKKDGIEYIFVHEKDIITFTNR